MRIFEITKQNKETKIDTKFKTQLVVEMFKCFLIENDNETKPKPRNQIPIWYMNIYILTILD